jgi:DNA-binding transcriptional MerR regulator
MTLPFENQSLVSKPGTGADMSRRAGKAAGAFRTISEVASDLDVPQHVLRFWETRFAQIRPLKRAGGRRYYRPEDVELLRRIRQLLYNNGYTIKGVQRLLRDVARPPESGEADIDNGLDDADLPETAEAPETSEVEAAAPAEAAPVEAPAVTPAQVEAAIGELAEIRDLLRKLRR